MSLGTGIPQEDTDLTVLHPTGRATVLAGDAAGFGALLEKAGFVYDQHGVWIAQMLDHVGAQVIAHPVRVPDRPIQQMLQSVGRAVAGLFGQLPAVLALE